jgi:hypothetical protein
MTQSPQHSHTCAGTEASRRERAPAGSTGVEAEAAADARSLADLHDEHPARDRSPFFGKLESVGRAAEPEAGSHNGLGVGESDAESLAEVEEEALTARAAEAAERLHEYQLWFPFIEEERPTADGSLSFMVPPGALLSGLDAIALTSVSGKKTPVTIVLTPGRARLVLERNGEVVETDVPLADFANLPRNGVSLSTGYATIRRLMSIEASGIQNERSARFTLERPAGRSSQHYITYKRAGTTVDLEAELTSMPAPLASLEHRPLHRPATARALSRALRHASALPKQTYYGPVVISNGIARGFSRYAAVEYHHTDIANVSFAVDLPVISDLASLLGRSKLGLRIAEEENYTAFSDGIIRYRVPRPSERQPQYSAMKDEALSGAPIPLSLKELQEAVRMLDAATSVRGSPTTVRLVVEQEGQGRTLVLLAQKPTSRGSYLAAVVEGELEPGEQGRLPMQLLLRATKSAAFETAELRLTKRAGALVQCGDGSTLTCIFPFHDALDEK